MSFVSQKKENTHTQTHTQEYQIFKPAAVSQVLFDIISIIKKYYINTIVLYCISII